jgi:hypothetical protein
VSEIPSSKKQEWSSTHTRVRIELFFTAIVIFAVHYLGLSLGTTAPFFFQFKGAPSVPWMTAGLYALFLYFLAAFVLRTWNEGLGESSFSQDLQTYIHNLRESTFEFERLDFREIPREKWVSIIEFQNARQAKQMQLEMDMERSLAVQLDALAIADGAGTRSQIALRSWANKLVAGYRELVEINKGIPAEIDMSAKNAISVIDAHLEETDAARLEHLTAIKKSLADLQAKTKTILRDTSTWRILLNAERIWLNALIPGFVSILLAASPLLRLIWPDISFV